MQLLVEPKLMERVVSDAARADPELRPEFERLRSACYDQPAEAREIAFSALFEAWFRRLGFRDTLESALAAHARVAAEVERAIVFGTGAARDQGVELFGDAGSRVLTLRICPATLRSTAQFQNWAAHELTYADDMLDPAFGYDRAIRPSGPNVAAANLARERYATLWSLSIDARLNERLPLPAERIIRRRCELARAFGRKAEASGLFDAVWREFRASRPTHRSLIERAQAGRPLGAAPGEDDTELESRGASVCPICGFSTFAWTRLEPQSKLMAAVIKAHSSWNPVSGLCERCAEVYAEIAEEQPPAIHVGTG